MYIKATNVVVVYLVIYSDTGLTLQAALILISTCLSKNGAIAATPDCSWSSKIWSLCYTH